MKNILLPTDFSKNSLNAIAYAMSLFQNKEVNFFVMNIQKASNYTTSELMTSLPSSSVYKGILADNKKKLNHLVSDLKEEHSHQAFTFNTLLDFDIFTDAIKQAIAANNIDLIIMGTNGATGAKEAIFGSNTLKVIRQIDCPLIAVPEGYTFQKLDSILFSINAGYSKSWDLYPLPEIIEMFDSNLSVLKITEKSSKKRKSDTSVDLEELVREFNATLYELSNVPIAIGIYTFEQLKPMQLHTFFASRESFLNRFFYGSKNSKISYGSTIPLLILHPADA